MSSIEQEISCNLLGCHRAANGYKFGVWAPNASQVYLIGDFNEWNPFAHPCVSDGKGNWFVEVAECQPGQGYKFSLVCGEDRIDRIDPRSREVTNSVGHSVIVDDEFDWQEDDFTMPPWNELVIYELHVGTYNAGTDKPGDFNSVIERLQHLKDMGINAIELMPLAEFAGDYSWGYNPAHPYAVETAYGGVNGLKRLIREAHKLGIAVIIDVVYNHFGPSDLDLWQFDGWSENGKGGIYFYNDWRCSTPWGDTRPDYGREEVRQYIFDNAMMWLEEYHADGLRYDMTLYIRAADHDQNNVIAEGYSLLQWINGEISRRFPGKITIAEDLQSNNRLTESLENGGGNFDAQWDAGFVHPIRQTLIEIDDANRSMQTVRDAIYHKYNNDAFERVIYTESHDEVANGKQRVVSEIDPNEMPNRYAIKRSTLGACLMMTTPGIPMLFQGQEFLTPRWFQDTDPLDWNRAEQFKSIIQLYSDLIHLRTNLADQAAGLTGQHVNVFHVNEEAKVIAFHRFKEGGPNDDVVVVFKFSELAVQDYRIGLPYPGKWKLAFNSDSKAYNGFMDGTPAADLIAEEVEHDTLPNSASFHIGAYSCQIFVRQE